MQDGSAKVVFIGSGEADAGKSVADELGVGREARFLVDPTWRIYMALGAHDGVLRTFTWRKWENIVGLLGVALEPLKGRTPGGNAGNQWLQGATLVVNKDGVVRCGVIEESPGHPRIDVATMAKAVKDETMVARAPSSVVAVMDKPLKDASALKWRAAMQNLQFVVVAAGVTYAIYRLRR